MMEVHSEASLYGAVLTPPGTAAIAALAIQGQQAWTVAKKLFRPFAPAAPWPPDDPQPGRFWLGRFGDPRNRVLADEIVLTLCQLAPQPRVEIHGHGGREVIAWIQETLKTHGVRFFSWPEFAQLTTEDPSRTAAEIALAEAPTVRTAGILLDQMHGAFARAVDRVRSALQCADGSEASRLLDDLTRYAEVGQHLAAPWRVAVLGAPNVGKSSLVNTLAGYQRSIVSPAPGTTRDVVTTLIALDGWPVELMDTAGLRDPAESVEKLGIDLAKTAGQEADLCLWIFDASQQPIWPDHELRNVRLIVNKIDLHPVWDLDRAAGARRVSAQTNQGIADLCRMLSGWLVPHCPGPGAAIAFTAELTEKVLNAKQFCDAGSFPDALRVLNRI